MGSSRAPLRSLAESVAGSFPWNFPGSFLKMLSEASLCKEKEHCAIDEGARPAASEDEALPGGLPVAGAPRGSVSAW